MIVCFALSWYADHPVLHVLTNSFPTPRSSDLQLFYYVHQTHDWLYAYGFDEASGNFQDVNFSGLGIGGDRVVTETHNGFDFGCDGGTRRSEEHTSELQSLMRISYAVFCLQQKKHERNDTSKDTRCQSIA